MNTTRGTKMKKLCRARTIISLAVTLWISLPQTLAAKSFETSQWYTKNGAHVIFYQAMEVPMLDISIAFAAGSAYDGEHFGLSALTTRLLNQGNKGLDTNTVAEKLAETGAQFEAASSQDMIALNLKTLTTPDALQKSSQLFASIIAHPDFPESSFNRQKNQQLMAISQALESPDDVANQTFFQILYKTHPYAHPIIGTRETINKLTLEQVHQFYQQFFVSANATLVLVGAINKSSAEQLAELMTHELPKGHVAADIPTAQALAEEIDIEVKFSSKQSILRLGQLGITHHDSNYFPLLVGNYILGGGALVSRMADELREKRGLTYGVYSQFSPMPGKGPFLISLSTKNNQAQTAINITRETLASFVKTGPNEQELIAAKKYLTGSFPLSLASNRSIADILLKMAFYHLPDDYLQTYIDHINAVSIESIKTAFQQLIIPNRLLQITVGKRAHKV
jgi:zinc protease